MTERITDRRISILKYENEPCSEIRPLYFYRAMGLEVADARIISFGGCNFSCHYCKRGGFFRNADGSIVGSEKFTVGEILERVDDAVAKGQVVRLSGGDPVVFQEESLFLGQYVRGQGGRLSMATNGSDPGFCAQMSGYLESAAVDLKDIPGRYGERTGVNGRASELLFQRSIESQKMLLESGVMVDVRTPVFNTTTQDNLRIMAQAILSNRGEKLFWTLRLYASVAGCDWKSPHPETVVSMAKQLKAENPSLKLGIRAKWEPSGFLII